MYYSHFLRIQSAFTICATDIKLLCLSFDVTRNSNKAPVKHFFQLYCWHNLGEMWNRSRLLIDPAKANRGKQLRWHKQGMCSGATIIQGRQSEHFQCGKWRHLSSFWFPDSHMPPYWTTGNLLVSQIKYFASSTEINRMCPVKHVCHKGRVTLGALQRELNLGHPPR